MKKYLVNALLTASIILTAVSSNFAQDQWTQGKKGIYSIGLGGAQVIGVYQGYHSTANLGLSINASGEYKVYKFIGLGWQTGINVMFPYLSTYYLSNTTSYAAIGIPVAVKCNVHILDAVGGVSIADKLDVYAGLGLGGGPLIPTYNGGAVAGFVEVGPQVGVRYWFKKVAIFGEFGWGTTFANAGVTF